MSLENVVDELDASELAIEPRSLALIAYYDGWGQSVGLPAMTYPRRITRAEAEHWQEGWDEGKTHTAAWEEAAASAGYGPARPERMPDPVPAGFHAAGNWSNRWVCDTCEVRGLPHGKWMETHRRGHAPCPRCGRQLTVKLDGTPRVHTRCPNRPGTVAQREYAPSTGDASGIPGNPPPGGPP